MGKVRGYREKSLPGAVRLVREGVRGRTVLQCGNAKCTIRQFTSRLSLLSEDVALATGDITSKSGSN